MILSRSSIKVAFLKKVFPVDSAAEAVMHANIARLIVLYEDLRIEIASLQAGTIKDADWINQGEYRKRYFLRRSIGTIVEFADAFGQLRIDSGFNQVRRAFDAAAKRESDKSFEFFQRHKAFFERVRNDLGGHFGTKASKFAIESFTAGTTGTLEIVRNRRTNTRMFRPQFVGEITARAFLRHLQGRNFEEKLKTLLGRTILAYQHAVRVVTHLLNFYLWDRF